LNRVKRVLLVEDNAGDARLFAEMMRDLGGETEVDFADTLTAAILAVRDGEFDVVLLDLGLPESVGLDTYTRFRAAAPDAAVVVLTGNTDLQLAVSAVDAGAQDFLVKGQVEAELLGRALTYAVSRKASEIELRTQAKVLEEAQQVAHLGSWRVDARTQEVTLSRELLRIFGLDPETEFENVPEPVRRLLYPEPVEAVSADRGSMHSVEGIPPEEYPIERSDGQVRWVARRANWELDAAGAPLALIGTMQDITERVESQEAIRRSEGLNRLLVDGLREHAVLMLSSDGDIAGWNAGAERLFGYTAHQAQGLRLPDLAFDEVGAEALVAGVVQAADEGRASTATLLRRGPVESFWGELWISCLEDQAGSASGLTVVVRDETESKSAADREAVRSAVRETLTASGTLESAWPKVLRDICFGMGWEIGEAWAFDEEDEVLHFQSLWSADRESTQGLEATNSRHVYRRSELPLWQAMRGIEPVVGADLTAVAEGVRLFGLKRADVDSVTIVPVSDGGRLFGVMLLFGRDDSANASQTAHALADIAGRIAQFAARERLKDQVKAVGFYDGLTGLPNRALFIERLAAALIRRPLRGEPGVLVVIAEVDQLDPVNDTYGHFVGDRLLLSVAERLGATLGAGDTVAHLSGGVFGVLVQDVKSAAQEEVALDALVSALVSPIELDGATVYATVSTGSARGGPSDAAEELMRCAAIALHQAKSGGRGGRVLFDHGMRDVVERALSTEGELRRALATDQFIVYYQPIIDVATRRITGAEALVRWMHPSRGLVPPIEFIPTAEATGLIGAIGEFVLRTACLECARWSVPDSVPFSVAVNLSANQFSEGDLAQFVLVAIHEASLAPSRLTLEITESVLMGDAEKTVRVLDRLHDIGVGVSVDDFGTGYSSLSYLKRFAIDSVKVDRSFVQGLPEDSEDTAIVTAVQQMARALGLRVIAEGVETRAQFDFLAKLDCEEAQGFLFSRPVPAEEFRALLRQWEFPSA